MAFLGITAGYWVTEAYASFSNQLSDGFLEFILVAEVLYPLLMLGTAIAFIMWAYRAHANVELLGRTGLNHQHQATIWWWITPVANLWMPFRVMYETVRGSQAPLDDDHWRNRPLGANVIWWTAAFIIGMFTTRFASTLLAEATTYEEFDTAFLVNGVGALAMVVAALAAISIVNQVLTDQEHLAVSGPVIYRSHS